MCSPKASQQASSRYEWYTFTTFTELCRTFIGSGSCPLSEVIRGRFCPYKAEVFLILPQLKPCSNMSDLSSFHSIALTSQLVKVFEAVIRDALPDYLESNDLLGKFQQGFRKGRSCLSSFMTYYQNILKSLEEGINVDSLFLDFTKAFDKVNYSVLHHRLWDLRGYGRTVIWIYCFLKDRTQ